MFALINKSSKKKCHCFKTQLGKVNGLILLCPKEFEDKSPIGSGRKCQNLGPNVSFRLDQSSSEFQLFERTDMMFGNCDAEGLKLSSNFICILVWFFFFCFDRTFLLSFNLIELQLRFKVLSA